MRHQADLSSFRNLTGLVLRKFYIMLTDASNDWPPMLGAIYLYVHDTDNTYQQAMVAGATSLMEPADQFHGDRMAGVKDPFGNVWWIVTHVEDVEPEELQRRADGLLR